jgi:hypothetical protein
MGTGRNRQAPILEHFPGLRGVARIGDSLAMSDPTQSAAPLQRIAKVRRDYNTWVANETLEDYALRFTPRSFRQLQEAAKSAPDAMARIGGQA